MAKRGKTKVNWEQLDLFAELDDQPTEGVENGKSISTSSPTVSAGSSATIQGIDSRSQRRDGTDDSGSGTGTSESTDPSIRRVTDNPTDDTGADQGRDQHGEDESRGNGLSRGDVRDARTLLEAQRFQLPSTHTLVPSGAKARAEANIEAIRVLNSIKSASDAASPAYATASEQEVLARYSGWGACQEIFDEQSSNFTDLRNELKSLLSNEEYVAARHSTLNAHYTDPSIADAMLTALESLGLPPGAAVLEPGCGTGNFIGLRDGYGFVGVELDPTSASIAEMLYPDANILARDFADKKGGGFDAAIGNVPFGDYKVADPEFNSAGHNIHNYFIIKSLRLTKPGGLAAFVTSSYTLNSRNPAARIEMARYGEFLGAVRLPNQAHSRVAGTTVLTDIILFRRSAEVASVNEAASQEWIQTQPIEDDVRTNSYFLNHPEMVLGQAVITKGRFGPTLEVESDPDTSLSALLGERLGQITTQALAQGRGYSSDLGALEEEADVINHKRVGSIYQDENGEFVLTHSHGRIEPYPVKGAAAVSELRQLLKIRDTYDKLLIEESKPHGDPEPVRMVLNEVYDTYVAKYGPINRFTLSSRKQLDDDGVERMVKVYPKLGGFRKDKMFRAVAALENFDEETGIATKAAIFSHSVLSNDPGILGVDDPAEAIAVSLSQNGHVDLVAVSHLLGMTEAETIEQIKDLVFTDPVSGTLIDSASYLSGNVRTKLAQACQALEAGDESQARNVAALEAVVPADLAISEIRMRLGSTWIAAEVVEEAFNTITSNFSWDKTTVSYEESIGHWQVKSPGRSHRSTAITHEYGVPGHMDATKILENLLNNREIQIRVMVDEKMVIEPELTAQARDKADLLQQKVIETIIATPHLAERVARTYNDRFNAIVPRSYNGDHLQLSSLSRSFKPHDHQKEMVARILHSPTALAAHPVGAGKTAEMVIAGQILRRSGKIKKPLYAVPNHMLEQFAREYLQLYPNAKILVADKDEVTPASRAEFVSRCATEFWDAVIMSHSSFGRIPLSVETEREFLMERHIELETALSRFAGSSEATVKAIEKKVTRELAKLKSQMDSISRDDSYTFEQMGVDYIFVDEAHLYKNLATISSSSELSIVGSQRATDLEMKLHYLRKSKDRDHSPRVATFATATPVANSPTEAYVMMRYLAGDALSNAQILHFDDFAATFTEKVSVMELSPTGTEYRMKERIAKFRNLPELHMMFSEFMDYISPEEIKIPAPSVRGGGINTINIPGDESLRRYTLQLGERAKAVKERQVPPEEDNFLKITSDGRKAALDLRLVGRRYADPTNSKVKTAAKEIYTRYIANKDNIYNDIDGRPHPRPGALQMVFCDQSTPHEDNSWNVYDSLRDELVRLGMPQSSIRFIHEAKSDEERARLFQSARSGAISVLIGSTGKMGTGVNVQQRAIAVHHMDAPWRPDELTQRNGRVVRQGNQNKEVDVIVYVNEGSFDVFLWQTLARKKNFIDQVLTSNAREVEDESTDAISYAQVKALATGNPLHIRKAELDSQIAKLERRHRTFQANYNRGRNGLAAIDSEAEKLQSRLEAQVAIANEWKKFSDYHGQETSEGLEQAKQVYNMTITQGWQADKMEEVASEAGTESEINAALIATLNSLNPYSSAPVVMEIDGLQVGIRHDWNSHVWSMWLTTPDAELGENPTDALIMTEDQTVKNGTPRIIRRIFNDAKYMEARTTITKREIDKLEDKREYFEGIVANSEFPDAKQLADLRQERLSIVEILEATSKDEEELVKDILEEDDPYVLGPDDLFEDESEDDDEDFRFVASASVGSANISTFATTRIKP